MSEKIKFVDNETEEEVEFTVLEQTRINNVNYLLVSEGETEQGEEIVYMLKDLSEDTEAEARYQMVEDDNEMDYVTKIFAELLEDVDIEKQN